MTGGNVRWGGFREGAGRKPIPDRVRSVKFVSLIPSPSPQSYKCGHTIFFRSRSNHRKSLALTLYCGSWDCPRCNEFNKQKWMLHIRTKTILGAPGAWFHWAYLFETVDCQWKSSVKTLLSRHKTDFVRIRLHDGTLVVINDGGFGDPLCGEEFDSALERIFAAVGHDRKPIFTSKGWRLDTKVASFQWERLGILNMTLQKLREELGRRGIYYSELLSLEKDGITFQYPDSWTEEDMQKFAHNLTSMLEG